MTVFSDIIYTRHQAFQPNVKAIAKELARLSRETFSNGQIHYESIDDSLTQLHLYICPNDGIYYGAKICFHVDLSRYPTYDPTIRCETPVLHPNIEPEDGSICFNILDGSETKLHLDDYAHALLWLINHPNSDDPLHNGMYNCGSFEDFERHVRLCILGELEEGADEYHFTEPFLQDGLTRHDVLDRPYTLTEVETEIDASFIPLEPASPAPQVEEEEPSPAPTPLRRAASKAEEGASLLDVIPTGRVASLVTMFNSMNT